MDANGGANKRFKAFEPDAVMVVPPSLEEWLPQDDGDDVSGKGDAAAAKAAVPKSTAQRN